MNIEWTILSKDDYFQNIEYLENYWTEKEVLNFITEVDYCINLLSKGNVSFIKSDFESVFKMVIIKQITLYYSLANNKVFLLRFWNNYQDLKDFKLK
jgi:hypothetical protein